ncbi:spore gernimation protein [Lentibacillus cibarius]|uniref:Spore gernimation protein n=1 Tax=Lentibacillus cibarius TaxID=2583219 RepID=A0A549YLW7_9BACI|nr:GerMN domain-containing protein [Lentibacillus cibarius]TRM12885.1 spore gernimation protein [Lentibacillus cibarius]
MQKRSLLFISLAMLLAVILSGCFQGEQSLDKKEEIDPPQNAEAVNDTELDKQNTVKQNENAEQNEGDRSSKTMERQLYLLDANGMVASQTLQLPQPESNEVASQALEYLVKGGPVTPKLPNGFQAVLPAGTEILGLNLKDNGEMIVNVSKDFENYQAENELKILQAMTYTLTQFEGVNDVKLQIEGQPQQSMPVNGTPIGEGYSRANGINFVKSDSVDLMKSKPVTLFYPSVQGDNQYFVPVTQYVDVEDQDIYGSMINTLLEGPGFDTNLQHVFNSQAELTNNPSLRNGVLEVMFSQDVLQNSQKQDDDKAVIADEVMETLVRTLTQDESVEAVEVKVEDVETLFNENGDPYTEPVTKQKFISTQKL